MKADPRGEKIQTAIRNAENIAKRNARTLAAVERDVQSAYAVASKKVRAEMADIWERHSKGDAVTIGEMEKYGRLEKLQKDIQEAMNEANARAYTVKERGKRAVASQTLEGKRASAEQILSRKLSFRTIPTDTIDAITRNPMDLIVKRRLWTNSRARIETAIISGLSRSASFKDISGDIKQAITGTTFDALRIARTETHRAENMASIESDKELEKMGIEFEKIWLSAKTDPATREQHADMHMEKADKDGIFHLPDGASGPAPGLIFVAEHDIQCRCSYIAVPK